MGTNCTVGFSNKDDLEDYQGIYIHYDGYPEHIVPVLALYIKFGKFDQIVKEINSGLSASQLLDYNGKNEKIFKTFEEPPAPVWRDDFFQYSYSYVLKKNKVEMYHSLKTPEKEYDFNKINIVQIVKENTLFHDLFSGEKDFHGDPIFYNMLEKIVWSKLK